MNASIQLVANMATAIGVVIAAIGLWFTWSQLRQNDRTAILTLTESTFHRLLDLEKELPDHKTKKAKMLWDSRFFNTLEWFSFVINTKFSKDKNTNFFDEAIIHWYEKIYLNEYPDRVDDPKHYSEFKVLYKRLKDDEKIDTKIAVRSDLKTKSTKKIILGALTAATGFWFFIYILLNPEGIPIILHRSLLVLGIAVSIIGFVVMFVNQSLAYKSTLARWYEGLGIGILAASLAQPLSAWSNHEFALFWFGLVLIAFGGITLWALEENT